MGLFWHSHNFTADGSPMSIKVKDKNGVELANGTIQSSEECATGAVQGERTGEFRLKNCRSWGYTDFSNRVRLVEGERYAVEFSAGAYAGFSLHTFFPLDYGAFDSKNRNFWEDSHAEVSRNNGQTWSKWAGRIYQNRDINLLFTIEGMPKQLP